MQKSIVLHIEMIKIRDIMYDTHYTQKASYINALYILYLFSKSHWADDLIHKWDPCAVCNKIIRTGEDLNTQTYRSQADWSLAQG